MSLVKTAPTDLAAFMVTAQVLVPEQAPVQPRKAPEALAVSVTTVPSAYTAEQYGPQSIPAGLLVTQPWPDRDTLSVWVGPAGPKLAVTLWG